MEHRRNYDQNHYSHNLASNEEFNLFSNNSSTNGHENLSVVSAPHTKCYQVQFQINYQTDYGQDVYIIGSIPELGKNSQNNLLTLSFKEVGNHLLRNQNGQLQDNRCIYIYFDQGHNWVSNVLTVAKDFFEYKYVIVETSSKKAIRWEQGFNRIADLKLLDQQQTNSTNHLIQKDEWDRFTIVFSIFYPLKDENEYMRINGDIEQLGMWNKGTGPERLVQGEEITWLTGQKVRPWEYRVRVQQSDFKQRITYKYSIRNDLKDYTIWEREPSRYAQIQEPGFYLGELGDSGSSKWPNVDNVFIVNGMINKADANFVGGLSFDKIADTKLFIGPYPQLEEDVIAMAEAGVTGVLNVQTDIDIAHRGINWPRMLEYYAQHKVTAVHYPIHDFNEEDLKAKIKGGADILNQMINQQGLDVYVHCTAGMGRAPAVVLTYLCLYKGMDPDEADLFVKTHRKVSVPNMRAVREIVSKHRAMI
eukprot:403373163